MAAKPSAALKLPNMNEFSPGVLEMGIRPLLQLLEPVQGDRSSMLAALVARPRIAATPSNQRDNRANNVLIGMSQCGLFDLATNRLTAIATDILAGDSDEEGARRFARHILRSLHGLHLLQVASRIRARQEELTNDAIRRELRNDGFTLTTNEPNPSKLRLWLEESKVVDDRWHANDAILSAITGMSGEVVGDLDRLTAQQRVMLNKIRHRALTEPDGAWIDLAPIKALIELEHGPEFLHGGTLRQKVIAPLVDEGWLITEEKPGRGGKIGRARPTAKLVALKHDLAPPVEAGVPVELRGKLKTPLTEIFANLVSEHKQAKGDALELLALRIILELGLVPVGFRLRAKEAEYAEADLTADGVHLHYSRWLVKCKNTPTVTQPHLMREIGLATVIRAHVILLITTGEFGERVEPLAQQVARESHLQVLLVDRKVLAGYRKSGITVIIEHLKSQAGRVLELKAFQSRVAGAALGSA